MNNSQDVLIQSTYPLAGTLTIPEERRDTYPAVLIIAGTGKSDRDGNMKKVKFNIYKELADFLNKEGFATLRYDKRGTHQSGGDYFATGLYDLIDDAVQCVKFLENNAKVNKKQIYILGHSEGALIAPAVSKKNPVAGLILLAGAAEPSADLLPRQNEMAYQEMNQTKGFKGWLFRALKVTEKSRKQNAKIVEKILQSNKEVMRIKGIKINAKWVRETLSYNVNEFLEEVTCPVLAITGDKDIQVPPEHAKLIVEKVRGESEGHIIPDMNHIFRKYNKQHAILSLMKEYKAQQNQPIDENLLDIMSVWLQKRKTE